MLVSSKIVKLGPGYRKAIDVMVRPGQNSSDSLGSARFLNCFSTAFYPFRSLWIVGHPHWLAKICWSEFELMHWSIRVVGVLLTCPCPDSCHWRLHQPQFCPGLPATLGDFVRILTWPFLIFCPAASWHCRTGNTDGTHVHNKGVLSEQPSRIFVRIAPRFRSFSTKIVQTGWSSLQKLCLKVSLNSGILKFSAGTQVCPDGCQLLAILSGFSPQIFCPDRYTVYCQVLSLSRAS